jgi:molybdopterin-guanine dinucleotide biosynthesis protein A
MNTFINNCTGIILAGGENTRMPVLKGFIEVEGRKIIERNLRILKDLFKEVFIVTNQPEAYAYLGVPMLGDIYNTRGPMTGIVTALLNSSHRWVFISACDMPFVSKALIEYMSLKRNHCEAVVPESLTSGRKKKGVEPLFSFYSKNLLGPMEKAVLEGNKSLRDFLASKRVKYIPSGETMKVDPKAQSFINLNTPEDIDLHLQTNDKSRFKRKAKRRGKCSV